MTKYCPTCDDYLETMEAICSQCGGSLQVDPIEIGDPVSELETTGKKDESGNSEEPQQLISDQVSTAILERNWRKGRRRTNMQAAGIFTVLAGLAMLFVWTPVAFIVLLTGLIFLGIGFSS